MGATAGTAGINFAGTNADVTFGTTTIDDVGANQTGIDFSGSSTTADFGLTTITGLGDLTSRGIDLSSTTGNKVITFLQGSKIDNVGVGVELSSGQTTATSANANFTFGDGDSTDGLESFIIAAAGGFTVNTVGLDPTLGNYDFDDVFFTGSANLATAPGSVTLVSQSRRLHPRRHDRQSQHGRQHHFARRRRCADRRAELRLRRQYQSRRHRLHARFRPDRSPASATAMWFRPARSSRPTSRGISAPPAATSPATNPWSSERQI